jgi:tRNA threonylcarbamoyladenosine biosynthesis protein TsaB
MRILAVDTTSSFGSIALYDDGLLEQKPLHAPEGFNHFLFSEISELLARHQWTLGSIERFAAAIGPGSFTGVRIGISAIKGLASALDRQVVGVSNLQALALFGTTSRRAAIINARRGEMYGALYDSQALALSPEVVMPFEAWLASQDEPPTEILSTDFSAFRACILPSIPVREHLELAAAVASFAATAPSQNPALLDANYVRRSDAELMWREV